MRLSPGQLIALIAVIVAASVFAYTLMRASVFVTSDDTTDSGLVPAGISTTSVAESSAMSASSSPSAGVPVRLRIPSIGVDANVQHVGLGKTGNMAVPTNYTDVGWYRYGTEPGLVGSAVIDGHIDNGFGTPAVFAHLSSLTVGDDIYIDTAAGETLHFVVQDEATYPLDAVPREKLFTQADAPRLNLITCDGTWDAGQKMYNGRHIVYAVLVEDQ